MSKVFTGLAVSVDGYISGKRPEGADEFGSGLGDAPTLFDWYFDGDTPSQVFDGFKLSEPSARFFDSIASRVGAIVVGHTTYEHSSRFGGGSPHPTAPMVLLSNRLVPEAGDGQTVITTGVEDAIAAARDIAGSKDVGLMGGGLVSSALAAGLVDEVILHQVPILLGGGRRFFHELPEHVELRLLQAVPAPGVTHLHYGVGR
ncbi:riboflavin biosynthesis protein [Amycolatopsis sp. WAC 04197]|uniref:dihydrofolate reductase family protein n=1 Tax=Amycolatopsis sp. WAC 04197 TaxID=2203199 RepID=UPI000F78589A|nr:dihydrofolate reductase family protein [Amycolatopsis sp. WAC 04197]RSN44642.1 riboflavin biosynthesis protein [Amycolatopsis sp. WAC 04197]